MTVCAFCKGVGMVQAGNTTIKDPATQTIKTVSGVTSSTCQSCQGRGYY